MKQYIISALMLAGALGAGAQSKLDLPLSAMISEQEHAAARSRSAANELISVIITFDSPSAAAAYASECETALDSRADMVIATLSADEIAALDARTDVRAISVGFDGEIKLDNARKVTGVTDVHAGTGIDHGFTGKGVIASLYDSGIDANHANFMNGTENRIKTLWTITGNTSAVTAYDTPEKISRFETENKNDTHGTHVLGIMAGGFKGSTRVAYLNDKGTSTVSNKRANPYYGVATDAELAVCCGTFESANTSLAAGLISEYARNRGLPAVMNLSLGNNMGPHDGTSATNRYLAEVGKEMIICLSAGNEGSTPISLQKTFTASDKTIRSVLAKSPSASGNIDIWCSDNEPVTVTISGYNTVTGATPFSMTFSENLNGGYKWYGGKTMSVYTNIDYDQKLDDVFGANASLRVATKVDGINKRYNVYVTLDLGAGASSRNVVPTITVEGKSGKSIAMYSKGVQFMSNGLAGYADGNDKGTISDMACGDNIIAVGAYTNRTTIATLAGKGSVGGTAGDIAYFSSYGTTFDGRQLPTVAGPGHGMISSYSYYYIQNQPNGKTDPESYGLAVNHTHGNRASYWGEMSGTSMSSPYVAGVIALWLEADPTLTVAKVKEVMAATCTKDNFTAARPERFGFGKINALEGIKYILSSGAVTDVTTEGKIIVNTNGNGIFDIVSASGSIDARLYTLSGVQAAAVSSASGEATLDASSLAKGIYVLRVNAGNDTDTRKVTIR